jgi:prepilin-type N-terminal cleavage/methylation domain-containing protein
MQVHESMPLLNARPPVSRPSHDSSGFTLIELVAVIALLAIMASVAVFSLDSTRSGAEGDATRFEMSVIRKALLQFKYDVRHFPDGVDEVIDSEHRLALLSACQSTDATRINETSGVSYDIGCTVWDKDLKRGWNGPYLSAGGKEDAWGNAYRLLDPADDAPSTGVARIVSYGKNGVYEGENTTDPCLKFNDASDDIVLCLVQ